MLYLGTPFGDDQGVVARFLASPLAARCDVTHLNLFSPFLGWRETFLRGDLIFVPGGNTRAMLGVWKEWEADLLLREAYESGVILSGVSAGAICWFEQYFTDSDPNTLEMRNGLAFEKGVACPHYEERSTQFHEVASSSDRLRCFRSDVGYHLIDGQLNDEVCDFG
jgi:peptidase E